MLRRLFAFWLVCLALAARCAEAQNETLGAPTLLEVLTPTTYPVIKDYLFYLFPRAIFKSQTAIGIRVVMLFAITEYEPIAACHPVALSFFGTKDEVPAEFCSPLNLRILVAYVIHRVFASEFPRSAASFAGFLTRAGLTPHNNSTDKTTLNGWANAIGDRLIEYFANDGFNSQGDATRDNFRQRFSDQTGYKPVNPAFLPPDKLRHPLRWQPLTGEKDGGGDFLSQVHVVPQIGTQVTPLVLSREDFLSRKAPSPYQNPNMRGSFSPEDEEKVRSSIKAVFKRSEQMTLKKAALAWYWDSKFRSVGTFNSFFKRSFGYDRAMFVWLSVGENMALHDAIVLSWKEKHRHDLVRPTTMIRRLLKGEKVKAYRGVGKGIGVIKAEEWEPVIPPQPHSEYPSATAAICQAGLEFFQVALPDIYGNRTLPSYNTVINSGTDFSTLSDSPDITAMVPIRFETLDVAIQDCGYSRLDAGVHFPHSIPAGFELGKGIGEQSYRQMKDLWEGRVPENCARCIRS